jgi:hypothetical protein
MTPEIPEKVVLNSIYLNVLYTILKGGKWMEKLNDMLANGVFNNANDFKEFEEGLADCLINPEKRLFFFDKENLIDELKPVYDDFVSEWHGLEKSMDWTLDGCNGDEDAAAIAMNKAFDFPVSFYSKLYSNGLP